MWYNRQKSVEGREIGMNRAIKYLLNLVIAIMCVVVIISLAVSITVLFRPLYYFDIDNLEICETSGFSREESLTNYDALIDYNLIGGPDKLVFPSLDMSEEGEIHFKEVKDIFIPMQWFSIVGIPLIILGIVWEFRQRKKAVKESNGGIKKGTDCAGKWMRLVAVVAIGVVAVVLAAIVIDWQWAFETMHSIFFDNDYWIFNPITDPVIRILPDTFFMHCGILIIAITTALVIVMTVLYRKFKRI